MTCIPFYLSSVLKIDKESTFLLSTIFIWILFVFITNYKNSSLFWISSSFLLRISLTFSWYPFLFEWIFSFHKTFLSFYSFSKIVWSNNSWLPWSFSFSTWFNCYFEITIKINHFSWLSFLMFVIWIHFAAVYKSLFFYKIYTLTIKYYIFMSAKYTKSLIIYISSILFESI